MTEPTHTDQPEPPTALPARLVPGWLRSRGIACRSLARVRLGFGAGRPQYRLERYPDPGMHSVVAMVFEWHTADLFEAPGGPHLGAGLCGPLPEDPHRGRGLAIGTLCNRGTDPSGQSVVLFRGCPDPPGGPAMFIEDFTINEGTRPPADWQLSDGVPLPELHSHRCYLVELQVSSSAVWAGIWRRGRQPGDAYRWLGEAGCQGLPPEPGPRVNAFLGQGFARDDNRSWVEHWTLAHWRTQAPDDLRPLSSTHSSSRRWTRAGKAPA